MDGFLLIHGKSCGPEVAYCPLNAVANSLNSNGFLVQYDSYPWGYNRNYDATSMQAAEEIHESIQTLKSRGATRIHIVGHSMGSNLAMYYSTLDHQDYDSIIALCPAHNLHVERFQNLTSWSVEKAIGLVNMFNDEPSFFIDFQMGRAAVVEFVPSIYASYFDSEGPCNMAKSAQSTKTAQPVYMVIGSEDHLTVDPEQLLFAHMLKDTAVSKFECLQGQNHANTPIAALPSILTWINTF